MLILVLIVLAQRMGVNMAAFGIGVDFLQVVSLFSSFGFTWPAQLTSLFNAASFSSFNEQLFAPECSVGAWSFEDKYVTSSCAIDVASGLECFLVRWHTDGAYACKVGQLDPSE